MYSTVCFFQQELLKHKIYTHLCHEIVGAVPHQSKSAKIEADALGHIFSIWILIG